MYSARLTIVAAFALMVAPQGLAQKAPATQTQPAGEIDPRAQRVLRKSAEYLAGIKAFRVSDHTTVSMVIEGAPKQRQSVATLALQRPDKFALWGDGSSGETTVCDGQKVYTYRPAYQRYSVQEITAASLEKLKYRMTWRGVGGASAVSMLITDQPYEGFLRLSSYVTYVGTETLDGFACDRLRLSLPVANIDIWIRTGQQPLPVKIISTSSGKDVPRQIKAARMETVHTLQDWWLGDQLPAETFRFDPPAGAVQVARNELVPPPGLYPMVGKMAPAMTLELLDGGKLNLAGDKGKHVIILAFRDPEYPEHPSSPGYLAKVAELARAFQREDARFYAVCPQESLPAMRELLEKAPLDIPIALDPQERVAKQYLVVPGIPSTVVIDKQGKVQVVQIGFEPAVAEQLRRQIRDVLDGKDLAKEAISQERKKPSAQTHGTKAGEQNRPSPSTQKAEVGEKEKPPLQSHGAGRT